MSLVQRTIEGLKHKRERALSGKINCIPSPYKRFKRDFLGLEKGMFTIISSYTKGGKSQFTSYTFVYEPLLYFYNKGRSKDITFLYFPLEESQERIMQRFISFLLNRITNGKIRLSPLELRSTDHNKPLPQEALDIIDSPEFQDILNYFEERVIFSTESNPTGIYKFCKQYAEDHGKVLFKKGQYKDDLGILRDVNMFDRYIPDNPEEYVIPIIDTLNLIDTEKGMTLKQSMDKMSEYGAKYLRNRYNMSPIYIQQQSFEAENNDSFKLGRTKPSVHTLGDSKYTGRDANLVLGLFSPARFGIQEYFGYDITKLKDNVRFLEVCINRDGQVGGTVALFFDGATATFKELPLPDNKIEMDKVYSYVREINSIQHMFFMHTIVQKINKCYDYITNRKKHSN